MATLTPSQFSIAQTAAKRALQFTDERQASLPSAIIRYHWFDGSSDAVVSALAAYQNADGGFGNRLEPDIHHPSSNAFAARIAMQFLQAIPAEAATEMRAALQTWLVENQHEDGDWHFSDESKSGFMQPWFAAWQHPSLNPACCVAGLAAALDIATEPMLDNVSRLFAAKASQQEARNGEFYNLLPYIEYTAGIDLPDAATWYDLLAERIMEMVNANTLEDAEHFFTLAMGGSQEIIRRIPDSVISAQIDRLLGEQCDDGGWPTPYDDSWRVWSTAGNMSTLAQLR